MSARIYNGYKIRISDMFELKKFTQDLKKLYFNHCYDTYINAVAQKTADMTEYLPFKSHDMPDSADAIFKRTMSAAYPNRKASNDIRTADNITVIETAANYILNLWSFNMHLDITCASIILFDNPDTNSKYVYILINNNDFAKFMEHVESSYDDQEYKKYQYFKDKYDITEFCYHSTDKPDDISDEDWNMREQIWSQLIPDDKPVNHGITLKILDHDEFRSKIDNTINTELKNKLPEILKSNKQRLDEYTMRAARQAYAVNHKNYDPEKTNSKIFKEFETKIKNKTFDVVKLYNQYYDIISGYMIDFTDENIINRLIEESMYDFLCSRNYNKNTERK